MAAPTPSARLRPQRERATSGGNEYGAGVGPHHAASRSRGENQRLIPFGGLNTAGWMNGEVRTSRGPHFRRGSPDHSLVANLRCANKTRATDKPKRATVGPASGTE